MKTENLKDPLPDVFAKNTPFATYLARNASWFSIQDLQNLTETKTPYSKVYRTILEMRAKIRKRLDKQGETKSDGDMATVNVLSNALRALEESHPHYDQALLCKIEHGNEIALERYGYIAPTKPKIGQRGAKAKFKKALTKGSIWQGFHHVKNEHFGPREVSTVQTNAVAFQTDKGESWLYFDGKGAEYRDLGYGSFQVYQDGQLILTYSFVRS